MNHQAQRILSAAEARFDLCLRAAHLPPPVPEFRFHPKRRWRFDRAWPERLIAVEIDGGIWTGGRHTRGTGFTEDCRKLNTAALMGWRVLRFTDDMIRSGEAVGILEVALKSA